MVVEDFTPFSEWFPLALLFFLAMVCGLLFVGTIFGYLMSAVRHGPSEAFYVVARVYANSIPDMFGTSLRRVLALARLAVKETLQRRVLLVTFAIFAAVILLGNWFLGRVTDHPDRVYISHVLGWTQLLILVLAFVLTAFSLPTDIKDKTIFTVVTKPVRSGEIVLGRIFGFVAMGTLLLAVMWLVSYVFVVRGLSHTHVLTAENLVPFESDSAGGSQVAADERRPVLEGQTTADKHHRHTVTVLADGTAYTDVRMGHWHPVTVAGQGNNAKYTIGPQQGMLQARVPVYGKLRFLDRSGLPGRGVNVGNEWQYREYIEGATGAAAIWRFRGVRLGDYLPGNLTGAERRAVLTPSKDRTEEQNQLAEAASEKINLPVELTLSVFRTWKGHDLTQTVAGEIIVINPTTRAASDPLPFRSQEFSVQPIDSIRKQLNGTDKNGRSRTIKSGNPLDLFDDLVDENGDVDLLIRCAESGQYFGMAQADCYLRAGGHTFFMNLLKGYVSIWLQMVIVVCLGIMFSTFLNREVTLLATAAIILVGIFFIGQIRALASGDLPGGGPIESTIRIVSQQNVMTDLDVGILGGPIKVVDWCLIQLLHGFTYAVPDFGSFDTSEQVAHGYDVQIGLLARHICSTLGFFLVLSVLSYFILRTREIAA